MDYLIYKSRARVVPGSAACRDIVTVSQANNAILGLTGFLHAEDGLFIQYLEGPPAPLWTLYRRLHLDPRHADLVLLGHGAGKRRRFKDWRMGYSEARVMSLADFLDEMSVMDTARAPGAQAAILFLRAASMRLDLGIADPPQDSWV